MLAATRPVRHMDGSEGGGGVLNCLQRRVAVSSVWKPLVHRLGTDMKNKGNAEMNAGSE